MKKIFVHRLVIIFFELDFSNSKKCFLFFITSFLGCAKKAENPASQKEIGLA